MTAPAATPPRPSFWHRRLLGPLRAQLTQGVTPDKLALTLALGTACSLFPILGLTTALNLLVGHWRRLNHPILQAVNYLLTGVHLAMILVYVRLGEWLWQAPPVTLSVPTLVSTFHENPGTFVARFGWTGLHAVTAWLLTSPLLVAALYFSLRPVMRKFARR